MLRILSTWFTHDRGFALGILLFAFILGRRHHVTSSLLRMAFSSFLEGTGTPHLINGAQASSQWNIILFVTSGLSLVGGLLAFFLGINGMPH